jgi:hypothetical protein
MWRGYWQRCKFYSKLRLLQETNFKFEIKMEDIINEVHEKLQAFGLSFE